MDKKETKGPVKQHHLLATGKSTPQQKGKQTVGKKKK